MLLAGGLSRRFGSDKRLFLLEGTPLAQRTLERLQATCAETLIVTSEAAGLPAELQIGRATVLNDRTPNTGVLGAIWTGLEEATTETCFVAACDLPLLRPELVRLLVGLQGRSDLVVPRINGHLEPTCAVYSRACLPELRRAIQEKRLAAHAFIESAQTRYVDEWELRHADPKLESFLNANRPEDLERLRGGADGAPRT